MMTVQVSKREVQTSADARNILARACFIELDSIFVSPKSSKIGRWGGFLLTRKFPRLKPIKQFMG